MIGLTRGRVKLVPSHAKWSALYESEAKHLRNILSNIIIDVQHIGSTSVPGLYAKPIIDIAVSVKKLFNINNNINNLAAFGYSIRPNSVS